VRELLPASSRAPGDARRYLERALTDLPTALLDRVKLLVSELVTNAVVHGPRGRGSCIELTVRATPNIVAVEVADTGPGFEKRFRAPSIRDSGWGLFLVEQLSDRWGVITGEQTSVWFEIDRRIARTA
jgi:anti-sigma regulatory factor (Ser/Thr protein kinase)